MRGEENDGKIFFHHPSTDQQQLDGTVDLSSCKTSNERTAGLAFFEEFSSPLAVWVQQIHKLLLLPAY
jgi:hypothetical protein